MPRKTRIKPLLHSTELGDQLSMTGELDTQGSLLIKGRFSGSIHSASHVSVERQAKVESCSLSAESVCIEGRFSGSMTILGFAEFRDKSSVSASVECGRLRISPLARFEGVVAMPDLLLHDLRLEKPVSTTQSGN